uniref:Tobamovirus multiplication protein 2A-like n=1 Tax=Rhizophora mucronata TaxID=61149 RepID=A0A2P2KH58_RHIMU
MGSILLSSHISHPSHTGSSQSLVSLLKKGAVAPSCNEFVLVAELVSVGHFLDEDVNFFSFLFNFVYNRHCSGVYMLPSPLFLCQQRFSIQFIRLQNCLSWRSTSLGIKDVQMSCLLCFSFRVSDNL